MMGHRRPRIHNGTLRLHLLSCAILVVALSFVGCPPSEPRDNNPPATSITPGGWSKAFDEKGIGALSSVWGSGPDDVFMVGGQLQQGEVYHFDGNVWRAMRVPEIPFLVWCFGFGPDDVFAVGMGGGAMHYDGSEWTRLDTGVTEALWGVWGNSPDDLWMVGGDTALIILHYDGRRFTRVSAPDNDRNAESLYKVWGIGDRLFAVGSFGVFCEYKEGVWHQVDAGDDAIEDFISLWGTDEANIVAVGGRITARIATYDGQTWTTRELLSSPGLNAVFMDKTRSAVCGGVGGFVGIFDPTTGEMTPEDTGADLDIHAIWGDGEGRYYAVGGDFSGDFNGLALVRTAEPPSSDPVSPLPAPCGGANDCPTGKVCEDGNCVDVVECVVADDCAVSDECLVASCEDGDCTYAPVECDDHDPCTIDTCVDGDCQFAEVPDCGCDHESDCPAGTNCVDGVCTATSAPDIEVGLHGGAELCSIGPYVRLTNGDEFDVCQGFQGLGDSFATLRLSGFDPASSFFVRTHLRFVDTNCTPPPAPNIECDPEFYPCLNGKCSPTGDITNIAPATTDLGGGILLMKDVRLLVNNSVDQLDGISALLYVEIIDSADPAITASAEIPVMLFGRAMCSTPTIPCPSGQICNDDGVPPDNNYCERE